jgi:predicted secreted protein
MAHINGTLVLLNADGTDIASQKNCTLTVSQNLIDFTNKGSAGWTEHGNGMRNYSVSCDALASTTGLSAKELKDYIINRRSLLLVMSGLDNPILMKVSVSSASLSGPQEDATTISASFTGNGAVHQITAGNPNLLTDPASGGTDYDTFTHSGTAITSAINAAGSAYVNSNDMTIVTATQYRLFFFLTKTSGELPTMKLIDVGVSDVSNEITAVEGVNVHVFTTTASIADAVLTVRNTAAANWSTSPIYLSKII